MAGTLKDFTNGLPPPVEDIDLDGWRAEQNNAITTAGFTPTISNRRQMAETFARYAASGEFYTGGGVADVYTATIVAPIEPTFVGSSYFIGMAVRWIVPGTNTGASTINVNGKGAKNIKLSIGGDPAAGDLTVNDFVELGYDGVNFVILTVTPSVINSIVPPVPPVPVATNVEMEAAAVDTSFVTPLKFIQSPFAAKAMAIFNGAPVVIPALLFNKNITSIVRVGGAGGGTYDVTFANAFSSINYVCMGSLGNTVGGTPSSADNTLNFQIISTTVVRIQSVSPGTAAENSDLIHINFFGEI